MKKLMIAAAIVCAAAYAQAAAAITWASGTMKINTTTGSAVTDASSVAAGAKGTLYNITKAQYDTIMASIVQDNALSVDGMLAVYKDAVAGTYGTADAGPTDTFKGGVKLSDGAETYEEGTPYYALVTYTYKSGDDTFVIANAAKYDMGATAGAPGNMGLKVGGDAGTIAISQWAVDSVPEPTSGLLLLLGVAGLALRRRRA